MPNTVSEDRLTRMINRLTTQRACIDYAAGLLQDTAGQVVELGLGKGRTYDRLRHVFSNREVHSVDAVVHCPDDVRPPDRNLWVGDFRGKGNASYVARDATAPLLFDMIGSLRVDEYGRRWRTVTSVSSPMPTATTAGLTTSMYASRSKR